MAKAFKWNFETNQYVPYMLPNGSSLYESDLNTSVECAYFCGTQLSFGETYTSRRIHNHLGLGYAVCSSCYYEKDFEEKENTNVSN